MNSKANLTPEYITIDIAHGHSNAVIDMIQYIRTCSGTFVIAGNVGTPEAVRELENAGADATKVGIGPGKVCITKIKNWFKKLYTGCRSLAQKQLLNLSSLTVVSAIMATSLNPFALCVTMVMIVPYLLGTKNSQAVRKIVDGKAKRILWSKPEFQKGNVKT